MSNVSGKRIRLARIAMELKQVDVLAALSVDHGIELTQRAISDIEAGTRKVSDAELVGFSLALNVSPMWLLFGESWPALRSSPIEGQ